MSDASVRRLLTGAGADMAGAGTQLAGQVGQMMGGLGGIMNTTSAFDFSRLAADLKLQNFIMP